MKTKLKARVVARHLLDETSLARMFDILSRYYDGVSYTQFVADLEEKNDVILLESEADGICGFSTLLVKPMEVSGKSVIGVFSGDTILESKYWGSPALGIRFLIYLWMLKLKNPFRPVYWFLISKGYKTYLLMANNFAQAFPDHQRPTPHFELSLMSAFYGGKFGKLYNPTTGIIAFADKASQGEAVTCKLKGEVAPITHALRKGVPRVDFFERTNPRWKDGDELACIAKMTLEMPLRYFLKKTIKNLPLRIRAHQAPGIEALPPGRRNRRVSGKRLGVEHRKASRGE